MTHEPKTPWQRVFAKFGMTQAEFARAIGVDRSKVSIAVRDSDGLINGCDQVRILKAAKLRGVQVAPADLLPVIR